MKWVLFIILGLLLIPTVAQADSYCFNATSSAISWRDENGVWRTWVEPCQYNCSNETQRCNPGYPSSTEGLMIVGGLMFIVALLLFLAIKLDKKYWAVQYLFLFIALFMILTSIYFIANLQNLSWTQVSDVMTVNYTVVMWAIILFLFLVVIYFMTNIFERLIDYTKTKKSRRKR